MTQATDTIRATVRAWLEEARGEGDTESDAYLGKRAEPRSYSWSEPVELRVGGDVQFARCDNISEHGVGLMCRREIAIGTQIDIRRDEDGVWVPLVVRHCTQSVGSYKIGASFQY